MTPEQAFSQVLRKVRKEKCVSQNNLALQCHLDRTYISLLERGLRQPSLRTILQIALALDVSPSNLIFQVEKLLDANQEKHNSD